MFVYAYMITHTCICFAHTLCTCDMFVFLYTSILTVQIVTTHFSGYCKYLRIPSLSDAAHLRTPSKSMLLEILRLGRNCCLETSEFRDRHHEITV